MEKLIVTWWVNYDIYGEDYLYCVEYESKDKFCNDLEIACIQYYTNPKIAPNFMGLGLHHFVDMKSGELELPYVQTLTEWFESRV